MSDTTNTKLNFGFVPAVCGFQQLVSQAAFTCLKSIPATPGQCKKPV